MYGQIKAKYDICKLLTPFFFDRKNHRFAITILQCIFRFGIL